MQGTAKIYKHYRLITYHPSVVAWRNIDNISRSRLYFCPIRTTDMQYAGNLVDKMMHLTQIGTGCRLYVYRPLPSRLKGHLSDRLISKRNSLRFGIVRSHYLIRRGEILLFKLGHA